METRKKKIVGVLGEPLGGSYRFLFDAMAQLYPLEFRQVASPGDFQQDARLVLNQDSAAGVAAAAQGVPSFVVVGAEKRKVGSANGQICFGESTLLEDCLRNQEMPDDEALLAVPLSQAAQDEVIASVDGLPVWLNRPISGCACEFVSLSLPALQEREFVFEYLNRQRFFRLLPLVNFLRRLVHDFDWKSPALPACFVFDDPSLYWGSYGFLNFRILGDHAKLNGYCAAIGTIPIDSWWVKKSVAATFRAHDARLSLLIHGNNHTRWEFLANGNDQSILASAAQALRRMVRIEKGCGLHFARIMEMPHGAISHAVFKNLLAVGYDAILATTELLVNNNPGSGFPRTIGMHRTEMLGGGLPVIPRIKMTPLWKNDVLLAAFLRQPIVIVGHHQDAAHGLKLLENIAAVVNRLKGAYWSTPDGLLSANYLYRVEGDVLTVRMLARDISIQIPEGVRSLRVERPWLANDREELNMFCGTQCILSGPSASLSEPVRVDAESRVKVASMVTASHSARSVAAPPFQAWPILRKLLMEARDRLKPYVARGRSPSD